MLPILSAAESQCVVPGRLEIFKIHTKKLLNNNYLTDGVDLTVSGSNFKQIRSNITLVACFVWTQQAWPPRHVLRN